MCNIFFATTCSNTVLIFVLISIVFQVAETFTWYNSVFTDLCVVLLAVLQKCKEMWNTESPSMLGIQLFF